MLKSNRILFFVVAVLSAAMFFTNGCGKDVGTGKVTGVVTLNGAPLPNTTLNFATVDGQGLNSMGGTDSDGKYVLYYADGKTGAIPGKYKVTATNARPMEDIPESVPKKYLDFSTTDIEVEVKAGNNIIDVKLTSN
ncbi:MAG: Ig-like domain-containing protein [Planctomycetaceae bacterium]|jgi:hypothetical protein|nr:Ig-like domain-containing protein [Planctomycetaceae bacterium]